MVISPLLTSIVIWECLTIVVSNPMWAGFMSFQYLLGDTVVIKMLCRPSEKATYMTAPATVKILEKAFRCLPK